MSRIVQTFLNFSEIFQTCQGLSEIILIGPNLSEIVQTCQNLFKLVQTCFLFRISMCIIYHFFQTPKENKGRRGGSGVPEPAYCGRCDQHFNNPRYLLLHYKGGLISENISNLIPSSKFAQNHFVPLGSYIPDICSNWHFDCFNELDFNGISST